MAGACAGRTHLPFLLFLGILFPAHAFSQIRPIELEGFVISGAPVIRTAGTVTSHVTVLDGEDLRSRGVTRLADALSDVTGLVVNQVGSYGGVASTFFRGAESDHLKVLVDGVEMNQAGGAFDFSGLMVSDVERIEIVRGPASAFYGSDAIAGVIHIVTRRGHGPRKASLAFGLGNHGRLGWSANLHGGAAKYGYSLSLSEEESDGILAFNNSFKNRVVSGKLLARPDGETDLLISGRFGDRTYHFPTDGVGNVVDRNAFTFGEDWSFMAEAVRRISDGIEAVVSFRSYRWDGGSDDRVDGPADTLGSYAYSSQDAFRRRVGDLRLKVMPWSGSVLAVGFELEHEDQESESEALSEWGPSSAKEAFTRWNRGYYAHMGSESGPWAGNVGVRLDDNEQYGRFLTYQLGLSYLLPSTRTRIRGNLGRGLKEPTFVETSSTSFSIGNPNLDPERSRTWELGLEQTVGEAGWMLSVTYFHQVLEDLIQYTYPPLSPEGPNYFNVAEAQTEGAEVTMTLPLGGNLTLSGGYTYLASEVLDAGFDEGEGAVFVEGEALIRRPRHQGSATASYSFPRGVVSGDLR